MSLFINTMCIIDVVTQVQDAEAITTRSPIRLWSKQQAEQLCHFTPQSSWYLSLHGQGYPRHP